MLHGPGTEPFELEADLPPGRVEAYERDLDGPLDRHADPLQREAALLVGLLLVRRVDDPRVHNRLRALVLALEDEHPLQDPDLGRCQADALRVGHHVDHPLGELCQVVIERRDLLRPHAERDVRVLANLAEGVAADCLPLALGCRLLDALVVLVVVLVIVLVVVVVRVHVVVILCHSGGQFARRGALSGMRTILAGVAVGLVALAVVSGSASASPAGPNVPYPADERLSYLALAEYELARTERVFWNPTLHWYNERLPLNWDPAKPLARLWAAFPLFEAVDAVAIADPTAANKAAVRSFALGAEKYFNPAIKPVGGYDWYPGIRDPREHTYFDDNGWWELAFLDAYRATGDTRDLRDAERAFRFISVSGWDRSGGGVWWETLHLHRTSEPLAAEIYTGFALYRYTHQASYLQTAEKFLTWANRYSWNSAKRLYQRNETDATVLDYVEGLMIGAQLELCQIKHVQGPCGGAEQLAQASVKAFPHYADWTPAADLIYLRFMLDLYRSDGNPELVPAGRRQRAAQARLLGRSRRRPLLQATGTGRGSRPGSCSRTRRRSPSSPGSAGRPHPSFRRETTRGPSSRRAARAGSRARRS